MFSARVKAVTGSKASALIVIEYLDDRRNPMELVTTVTYRNVDASSVAKRQAFVDTLVMPQLQAMKAAEEAAQLQVLIGTTIAFV